MQPKATILQQSKFFVHNAYFKDLNYLAPRVLSDCRKSKYISGNQSGFALIEIIIAMLIIGIMLGISIPRFFSAGETSLPKFASKLNILIQEGISRATNSGQTYKLLFNFKTNPPLVSLFQSEGNKKIDSIEFPKSVVLQDLFINRKNEPGREDAWFFISPDGTAQEVIMNVVDTKIQEKNRQRGNYSLVLNPFSGQFKIYDTFQKPNA